MTFRKKLHEVLVEKRITPLEVGKILEINPTTVINWLSTNQLPTPVNLVKLLHRLEYDCLEIIDVYLQQQFIFRKKPSIQKVDIYDFKEEFKKYFETGKWWAIGEKTDLDLDNNFLSYIVSLRNKLRTYKPVHFKANSDTDLNSRIVLLPEPKIEISNDWNKIINEIVNDKETLYNISWDKFEDLVGYLLEGFGWTITPKGRTKDGGIDLIATQILLPDIPFNMMIQCKKYSKDKKVGMSIVKEVWSTKWENGFHQAMIATTSFFTKGAKDKAEKWNLELKDHENIFDWCKQNGKLII